MTIRPQKGFTLIELMVAIIIVGILGATAIPVYHTWLQRAYGSEAAIMVKQIMDAEITYYLEKEKFFPDLNNTIEIYHNDDPKSAGVKKVSDNLHIDVPTGHLLNYYFYSYLDDGKNIFFLQISSEGGFDLFKNKPIITYTLDESGKVSDLLEP